VSELHDKASFEQGVMVDVGEGSGALVIYTSDDMSGAEIEISPAANDAHRVHTEVLPRKTANGYVNAAVFGSLLEGDYRLWHQSLPEPVVVAIVSGEVRELDWR
jgi:hypothetical protein